MTYFNNQILKILNEIDLGNIQQADFDTFKSFINGIVDDKSQISKLYNIFGIKYGDSETLLQTIVKIANEKNISLANFKTWLEDGVFNLDIKVVRKLGSIFKQTVVDKVGATGFDRLAQTVSNNFNNDDFTKLTNSLVNSKQYRFTQMGSVAINTLEDVYTSLVTKIKTPAGQKTAAIMAVIGALYWGFGKLFRDTTQIDPKVVEQANDLTKMIEQRNANKALSILNSTEINDDAVVNNLNNNKVQIISFFDFISAKFESWGFGNLWTQITDFAKEHDRLMILIMILGAVGIIYRHQLYSKITDNKIKNIF